MKTALILGISGQDGSYLARLLLEKNYRVYGTSRKVETSSFANLARLGIRDRVQIIPLSPTDYESVLSLLGEIRPHEIYNLAGQSSVGLSFEDPFETIKSASCGTLCLLEAVRISQLETKMFHASSGECFGETTVAPADENTAFHPINPYGVAKASAHLQVALYRSIYGLFACSGLLFNHESPLRPERFVTQKIVSTACRIASGSSESLRLGNISIERDWGWAPEFVEVMWRILQQETPDDFVIATGQARSLQQFVEVAFSSCGLRWEQHVSVDTRLSRPSDAAKLVGNPRKAQEKLGWTATVHMEEVARKMIEASRTEVNHASVRA